MATPEEEIKKATPRSYILKHNLKYDKLEFYSEISIKWKVNPTITDEYYMNINTKKLSSLAIEEDKGEKKQDDDDDDGDNNNDSNNKNQEEDKERR